MINLQKTSQNVMFNMFIRLGNIRGGGQRVVRFYDPDRYIIEVGENMKAVCKRFIDSGMTPEQVAERMDVPMQYINECMQ